MPTAAKHPCARPGCPNLVESGQSFCGACKRERGRAHDRKRASPSQRGYGARWLKLRAAHLRKEPLCRACAAAGRVRAASEVDHIVPLAAGGSNASANLQSLCRACHSRKTMRESVRAGQARG